MTGVTNDSFADQLLRAIPRLEKLIGLEHTSEQYVRFRIDVLKAQIRVVRALGEQDGIRPEFAAEHESREGGDDNSRNAIHSPATVPFDSGLLVQLAKAIHDAVDRRGGASQEAAHLVALATEKPSRLVEIARAVLQHDPTHLQTLAEQTGISVEGLTFFGRISAAPFLAASRQRLKTTQRRGDDQAPTGGSCPLCGSPPGLAVLRREDGRRVLYCSLCGEDWLFPRLACPFCGGRDRENMTAVRLTESGPRWLEACEKCKHYLKTVDQRRLPETEEISPLVEDVATLHLDLLAEKEHYARGLPYAAVR